MKLSNINKPTSAKWVKFGAVLLSISTFISGYGLTQSIVWVGLVGLGIGVIGTALVAFKD